MLLAERLPGRAEFGGAVTNLEGEARRAGVAVVTGMRVDAGLVERESPDVVIVATGARPRRPGLELMGAPVVLDAWQVLDGGGGGGSSTAGSTTVPRGGVVVADWRGDWIGLAWPSCWPAPGTG